MGACGIRTHDFQNHNLALLPAQLQAPQGPFYRIKDIRPEQRLERRLAGGEGGIRLPQVGERGFERAVYEGIEGANDSRAADGWSGFGQPAERGDGSGLVGGGRQAAKEFAGDVADRAAAVD